MWRTECEDLQKLPVEGSTSPLSTSFRSGSQQAWSISIFITEMERNELEEWGQGARQVRSRTHHVFSSLLILSIIFALPPSCSQGLWVEWQDQKRQDSLEDISSSDLTTLHFTALQSHLESGPKDSVDKINVWPFSLLHPFPRPPCSKYPTSHKIIQPGSHVFYLVCHLLHHQLNASN